MKQPLFLPLIALSLVASGCRQLTESPRKYEKATVIQLAYVPSTKGSTSGGVGFTSSGKTTYTFGETVTTKETWAVVFKCEDHGQTFSLGGKDIYSKCQPGQTVWLEYVDVIETIDGKEVVIDHKTKAVHLSNPLPVGFLGAKP